VLLKNNGDIPATAIVNASGLAGPSQDYAYVGKLAFSRCVLRRLNGDVLGNWMLLFFFSLFSFALLTIFISKLPI
jgi:hypothetical protein